MKKKLKFKIKPCGKNIGAEIICNLKSINKKQVKLIKNSLNIFVFYRIFLAIVLFYIIYF